MKCYIFSIAAQQTANFVLGCTRNQEFIQMVDVRGKREARKNRKWKCVLSVEEREVTRKGKEM
jgi:hypothetical protein